MNEFCKAYTEASAPMGKLVQVETPTNYTYMMQAMNMNSGCGATSDPAVRIQIVAYALHPSNSRVLVWFLFVLLLLHSIYTATMSLMASQLLIR